MQFRFFRRPTRPREFEEEHEPNPRREVALTGAGPTPRTEGNSEWLWWLSSPKPESVLSGRGSDRASSIGRGWSLDEPDEPTSPPAA
jgi:hypothetical protein